MVIGIIGESCTGKSTIVEALEKEIDLIKYTGKDYLKLAGNEAIAKKKFKMMLEDSKDDIIVYIITEKQHLDLLPKNAIKVLVTETLDTIKERFKNRMNGHLPKPLEMMLERKHHMFDDGEYDIRLDGCTVEESVNNIQEMIQ